MTRASESIISEQNKQTIALQDGVKAADIDRQCGDARGIGNHYLQRLHVE